MFHTVIVAGAGFADGLNADVEKATPNTFPICATALLRCIFLS
jgi:hypothetical protein